MKKSSIDHLEDAGNQAALVWTRTIPTYCEYAKTLQIVDGDFKGDRYDPSKHPAQIITLQALDQGYGRCVIAKPVQDGGTLVALVPLFRRAIVEHQTVLLAFPSLDSSKDIWTTKVWPMLEQVGGQEPKSGGGSRMGAARVVTLPGGGRFLLRAAGGRGESQQASVSGDVESVEEVDDWPSMAKILKIIKRVDKGRKPLIIYTSTVKKDGSTKDDKSFILELYDSGTQTRVNVPCKHCGAFQRMEWEQVNLETETYKCLHCAKLWTEKDRLESLTKATRYDAKPEAGSFSIRWTALDSPFAIMTADGRKPCLAALCTLYKEAVNAQQTRNDHELLRDFYRDRLTRVYTGDIDTDDGAINFTPNDLQLRSMSSAWGPYDHESDRERGETERLYSRHVTREVPRDVQFVARAIDVQQDRVYWSLIGMDHQQRQWDLAWGYEYATRERKPFHRMQLFEMLDRVAARTEAIAGQLPIVGSGVDANYKTDDVLHWLASHPQWVPTYGASASKAARMNSESGECVRKFPGILYEYRTKGWHLRQNRCHIDTNPIRQLAQQSFLVQVGQPGSAQCGKGIELRDASAMTYFRHLCAETWDVASKKWIKSKGGGRWDWLDTRVYCLALLLKHLRHAEAATAAAVNPPPPETVPQEYQHWLPAPGDWNIT